MKHIAPYSRRRRKNLRKLMRPWVLFVPTYPPSSIRTSQRKPKVEKLTDKASALKRPENCPHFASPLTYPEIWPVLKSHARRSDCKHSELCGEEHSGDRLMRGCTCRLPPRKDKKID
ncbi:hypothetical protein PoB_001287600 [Plakobranchus ocellatus]|uniref:Uncharacterized protein n=1 Tax=Plakobranchus ocellatus TaxID=259542 RepID=A0AAV3YSK4_9GAST|nr:hypothetical protein PoB_001287600 [Plakobranchus ocellatus]